jgi:hypothetical protein
VTTLTPPLDARGQHHFAKSFIECRPSLFGIPAYGGSVSGSLVYGSPANRNGCKPFATAT